MGGGASRHPIVLSPLLAVLLALGGWTAGPAEAHANLVRSEPAAGAVLEAAPGELRLWFSEQPEASYSEVRLFDRAGQPLAGLGAARIGSEPGLLIVPLDSPPPGVYTVAWRALSAVEGHGTAGAFAFALGADQVPSEGLRPAAVARAAASGATPLGVVARWLTYLSLALLVAPLIVPGAGAPPTPPLAPGAKRGRHTGWRRSQPLAPWGPLRGREVGGGPGRDRAGGRPDGQGNGRRPGPGPAERARASTAPAPASHDVPPAPAAASGDVWPALATAALAVALLAAAVASVAQSATTVGGGVGAGLAALPSFLATTRQGALLGARLGLAVAGALLVAAGHGRPRVWALLAGG